MKMKKSGKFLVWLMMGLAAGGSAVLTSCSDDNNFDTNQYKGCVNLNVFGPSPVARGGQLRFLGTGMDQITKIQIPGCEPITDIEQINPQEIRIKVPQEAEPGQLTLTYPDGEIVTKTMLTYTEPIGIEEIVPSPVKPGNDLTIKGEYLNLINEVWFSFLNDSVIVKGADFKKHERHEIVLTVPEEAISGVISISDGKAMPNVIESEQEVEIVLPAVEKPLDLTDAKGGDVITIEGTDLDLVRKVVTPANKEIDFEYADGKIRFTLPGDISDGAICAVPASGVKVAVANIGVVVPTGLVAEPAKDLRAGDAFSVRGVNMDQVTTMVFPGVEAAVTPEITATKITTKWPEMAQSGDIVLNLKSGKTVTVAAATAKPEVTAFNPNPVAAAAALEIHGRNLDLVKEIVFEGGAKLEPKNATADKITVTVPPTAASGAITLVMKNDEKVTTQKLEVKLPECAYITVVKSEELHAGQLMEAEIKNGDKLTAVKVNGQNVQFIVTGETLYINLPADAAKNTTVTLISSNGEISYTYDVINPNASNETVIWTGDWDNTGWGGNQDMAWGGYDWSTVKPGTKLRIYCTPLVADGEWWCVDVRHGQDWAALPGIGQVDTPAGGVAEYVLSKAVIDDLVANGGLVITGTGYKMTKVTLE